MNCLRPLLLVVALVLQAVALTWIVGSGSLAFALLAHVLGGIAWGLGAVVFIPGAPAHAWWQGAAWAFAFPVAGPVAFLLFVAIVRRPPVDRSTKGYVVWNDQPHDDWDPPPAGVAGQSIVEILQSPRIQLRRNAVLALRELDPQLAIPLLRKGLQDSDEQVRIYAQNILSTMLEKFEEGIKQLEQRIAAGQFEPLTATRLAEQYFELVYLDVAGDEETASHYLAKALTLLERAATASPGDEAIVLLGFKYALRARDVATARTWLERIDPMQHHTQHLIPWLMELAFLEGDWRRLRALFAGFRRAGHVNPRIEDLARFWIGAPNAAGNA